MRIHIKITPTNQMIDYNHQHLLTGTIHKWLGNNKLHDTISLYSFSSLTGAKAHKSGLTFPNGSSFFISCWDNENIKSLIHGIQQGQEMFCGLEVQEVIIQQNPELSETNNFYLGSPVFIKRRNDSGKTKFYYYNDKESGDLLTETLKTKMMVAGLMPDETLNISFNQNYIHKRIKKIEYKRGDQLTGIKANWCPVIINGKPETKAFAWNVGLGNSTGIGFGAIK